MTLVPSGLALLISMRVIGGLGSAGLKISGFAQFLLIVLVLGAGTDYGLFLVFRFREELRDGREPREAVVRALARVGESISASAGTVIVALLTLLLASFGLYRDLGIPLAVGIAVMLLIGLTLLPALLAIFGRATLCSRLTSHVQVPTLPTSFSVTRRRFLMTGARSWRQSARCSHRVDSPSSPARSIPGRRRWRT